MQRSAGARRRSDSSTLSEGLVDRRVLTIGGANIEHGLPLAGDFEADAKFSIDPQPRLAGGSSVNHACRLLAMGIDVQAILPLAQADPLTRVILDALAEAARVGGSRHLRKDPGIRGTKLSTPFSTIIRQGDSRAVVNEFSPQLMRAFRDHVDRQLAQLGPRSRPDLALVGHVHADRAKPTRASIGFRGAITERILTAPELAGRAKYVNFGSAQYRLGTKRWGRLLRDHVDVFQLDLREIRVFCADAGLRDLSLESILGWFRERCTVVVSLERFGVIGQLVGTDTPVAAWPYLLEQVADSTGAGDAMGAGIVASMLASPFDEPGLSDEARATRFASALEFGRSCGAYACTTLGGAHDCPDLSRLATFARRARLHRRDAARAGPVSRHDLFLIDRAFDH